MLASTSAPAHLQQQQQQQQHFRCSSVPPSRQQRRTRSPRSLRVLADKFCRDVVSTPREKPVDDGSESSVTFIGAGGKEITIQCKKSEYILDAGLEAGLELPYTCRAGICGACVAKVVAGEVDQSDIDDISFTLEESEVAAGMSLICMSRPVADAVRLETQSDYGYSLGTVEWAGATGSIEGGEANTIMGRPNKQA